MSTQEEKIAFFEQYHGQKVRRWGATPGVPTSTVNGLSRYQVQRCFLDLKPQESISDEDAITVFEICASQAAIDFEVEAVHYAKTLLLEQGQRRLHVSGLEWLRIYDFLRSRGYLVQFRHYSPAELIEMGWAKYTEG